MGARVPSPTPAGWCSWYYFYTQVTEDDVVRNLRFLERHRRELPIDTVQIDDGYQADIGDWLTVNEKFPRGMAWLASEIKSAGFTPGLWLAPFFASATSKTFAEHPDWIIRTPAGSPVVGMHNWERENYGLDGTHPGVQAWLNDLFQRDLRRLGLRLRQDRFPLRRRDGWRPSRSVSHPRTRLSRCP